MKRVVIFVSEYAYHEADVFIVTNPNDRLSETIDQAFSLQTEGESEHQHKVTRYFYPDMYGEDEDYSEFVAGLSSDSVTKISEKELSVLHNVDRVTLLRF